MEISRKTLFIYLYLILSISLSSNLAAQSERSRSVETDPRVRQYIYPTAIIWKSATIEKSENLLLKQPGQIAMKETLVSTLQKNDGVLLDFGKELHGGIQIFCAKTNNGKAAKVRVRFGESATEAMSDIGATTNATNDHAIRDSEILIPSMGMAEYGNTGFRFVRIDNRDTTKLDLKMIRAVLVIRDLEYKGSFKCSDDRLNQIWKTGAYTVQLNMQEYLWDGIKRDKLVWVGDMHPEVMTINTVFGYNEVVPKSLDFIRNITPLPEWMNGISSYSIWWLLIHHSWYMHHGDLKYLEAQKPYIMGLLKQLMRFADPKKGEILDGWRFLDWASDNNPKTLHAGLHALLIMSMQRGAELCEYLNEPLIKKECLNTANLLAKHKPDANGAKQSAALMVLANLADAKLFNEKILKPGEAAGISTFYGYYVLQARAKAGDMTGCLDLIRNYWGGMLDMGATTFWEDFNISWTKNSIKINELSQNGKQDIHGDFGGYCYKGFRHSLCHGWASGPTPFLSEYVLGIKVIAPACKTVKIEPQLGDLAWAEGTFPTPYGLIEVRHEKQPDGNVKTTVKSPPEVTVIYKK